MNRQGKTRQDKERINMYKYEVYDEAGLLFEGYEQHECLAVHSAHVKNN